MAFWSTKAAISLKRVKIEKKLLWGPIGTHLRSFERYHPRPYGLPCPRLGVRTPPKTPIAIVSGTAKATNFKFGQNNRRVHPKKSPWKFWTEGSVGVSRDCPNFLVPPIIHLCKWTVCKVTAVIRLTLKSVAVVLWTYVQLDEYYLLVGRLPGWKFISCWFRLGSLWCSELTLAIVRPFESEV